MRGTIIACIFYLVVLVSCDNKVEHNILQEFEENNGVYCVTTNGNLGNWYTVDYIDTTCGTYEQMDSIALSQKNKAKEVLDNLQRLRYERTTK